MGFMKAVRYVRVSTDKQADRRVSLDTQQETIRTIATVHDGELVESSLTPAAGPRNHVGCAIDAETPLTDVPTESLATVKVRTMQSFFRKAVLAAYNSNLLHCGKSG